jgi:hypothetical protein
MTFSKMNRIETQKKKIMLTATQVLNINLLMNGLDKASTLALSLKIWEYTDIESGWIVPRGLNDL